MAKSSDESSLQMEFFSFVDDLVSSRGVMLDIAQACLEPKFSDLLVETPEGSMVTVSPIGRMLNVKWDDGQGKWVGDVTPMLGNELGAVFKKLLSLHEKLTMIDLGKIDLYAHLVALRVWREVYGRDTFMWLVNAVDDNFESADLDWALSEWGVETSDEVADAVIQICYEVWDDSE